MKTFKDKITLCRNARGCFILDTIKGCSGVSNERPRGCYGDCYANSIASRYRLGFNKPIKRNFYKNASLLSLFGFDDSEHESEIIKSIKSISMPFVRIGEMGDPSEDWEHTINVCKSIAIAGKPIVIITKHWKSISKHLYNEIAKLPICVNTSISAMDTDGEIIHRLIEYENLKSCCKSILRIVSCDYNITNSEGARMAAIQERLFEKSPVINTVFRPSLKNPLVSNKVINVQKIQFLKASMIASVYKPDSYLGYCQDCPDMCGINLK